MSARVRTQIIALWQRYRVCDAKALKRAVTLTTVLAYCLLVWGLWLKFNDNTSIVLNYAWLSQMSVKERFLYDLIPMQFRWDFDGQFIEILLNCVVFAPFGVLFNFLFQKRDLLRDVVICFGFSLFIELLQLFTCIGAFATIDLITNSLGYFVGYAAYRLIFQKRSQTFLVWFFRAINAVALAVFLFAILRTAQSMHVLIPVFTREL